jgi:predicted RNase H-like nuclease (RuvC/YqgF family)
VTYLIVQMIVCLLLAFALGLLVGWLLWGRRAADDGPCREELQKVSVELDAVRARLAERERERDELRAQLDACTAERAELASALDELRGEDEELRRSANALMEEERVLEERVASLGTEVHDLEREAHIDGMFYDIEVVEGIAEVFGGKLRALGMPTTKELLLRCGEPAGRAAVAKELNFKEELLYTWACIADLMRVKGIGEEFSELVVESGVRSVTDLAACDPEALVAEMTRVDEAHRMTRRVPTVKQVRDWKQRASSMRSFVSH